MAAKKSAAAPKAGAAAKKTVAKKNPFTGESKLAQFLTTKKLDPRRVLAASHALESLRHEDRVIKLGRRRAKAGEDAEKKAEALKTKPRSGRAVTPRALAAAMTGGKLPGPTKTRILRAVNHLLETKKQDKVELKILF